MKASQAHNIAATFHLSQKGTTPEQMNKLFDSIKEKASLGYSHIAFSEYDELYPTKDQIKILEENDYVVEYWCGNEYIDPTYTIKW